MKKNYCCAWMKHFAQTACERHPDRFDCADSLIHYSEPHNKFGIIIHDGGSSFLTFNYCPWCGTRLGRGSPQRMIDV
jgi:hypothetical protein